MSSGVDERREIERATTLELFLDLVFVFIITQLTDLVSHPGDLAPYGKAALLARQRRGGSPRRCCSSPGG